jgi:hypothetical protein
MVCGNSFPLVKGVPSNPLRSRERRFESCRGTGQRHKFEHSHGPQAVAVTAGRCCSPYPQLRSGSVDTARAQLSRPIARRHLADVTRAS